MAFRPLVTVRRDIETINPIKTKIIAIKMKMIAMKIEGKNEKIE